MGLSDQIMQAHRVFADILEYVGRPNPSAFLKSLYNLIDMHDGAVRSMKTYNERGQLSQMNYFYFY